MSDHDAARDMAACRRLLRDGSRSFFAASLLLPRAVREPACALYAFCRIADDLVDDSASTVASSAGRRRLRRPAA
jgi:phytoene synthase